MTATGDDAAVAPGAGVLGPARTAMLDLGPATPADSDLRAEAAADTGAAQRTSGGAVTAEAPGGGGSGRGSGMVAAERAVCGVRLLAAVLMLVGGVGYDPDDGHGPDRGTVLVLAVAGAALLVALTALYARAARAGRRGIRGVLAAACGDAAIVLGVTCVTGFPPRSLALVLLLLPLWEAALWAGLVGLVCMWVGCVVVLGGYVAAVAGPQLDQDVTALIVALPILLLTAIPLALLAEHLVAQVAALDEARQVADDRSDLLGRWSTVAAELFGADPAGVARRVVAGAVHLGASAAVVTAGDTRGGPPVAAAGDPRRVAALTGTPRSPLTWQLPLPGRGAWELRVDLPGHDAATARRREALGLLAAQGRAALAHAVLVEQLAALSPVDDGRKAATPERRAAPPITGTVSADEGAIDVTHPALAPAPTSTPGAPP